MELQALCYLVSYASEAGIIKDMNPSLSEINNLIDENGKLTFTLNDGAAYTYDFGAPASKDSQSSIKALRAILPVVGIIDLVYESIKLGIVTDISKDYSNFDLKDLNGDYSLITGAECFYFKINSEMFDDTVYKITFDKSKHDIKHKTEYASRTSQFVDTLMKRIMAKYNILLVKNASWNDEAMPEVPVDDAISCDYLGMTDSSLATDLIENQLKVLINYRDNFNNTTCTENVIDDIFVNIQGNEVRYGFFNIGQTDSEPVYDVINEDVSADDIDSLLRIRSLINEPEVKFNIFETLRKNNDTNLSALINDRITEYDERINADPKIEFTVTPLSIYCNHIVEKTCSYKLRSINPKYASYELDYSVLFNPANIQDARFSIYGDGEEEDLRHGDQIVIAFDDVAEYGRELNPKITSKAYASKLYGLNKYYSDELYKDVYFLNENLVKVVDGVLTPYDGTPDANTYLKSQVVKCEIQGKYCFIHEATSMKSTDILGIDFLEKTDDTKYVNNIYARSCEICGHIFGATDDVWEMHQEAHKLINDENKRACCDVCAGTIVGDKRAIFYSAGYKRYYVDDPEELKVTALCINCATPEDSFVYIGDKDKTRGRCSVCKRYYCGRHIDNNSHICVNCSAKTDNRTDIKDEKMIKRIKSNLDPIDALANNLSFNYNKDENALWVYSRRKNKTVAYYLVVDDEEKFFHVLGKNVIRGDK